MNFEHSHLNDEHDIDQFDCGRPELNEWLQRSALHQQKASTARTYVWTLPEELKVLAFYAVAPTYVVGATVPPSIGKGFNEIPSFLIAQLALDQQLHGHGLGAHLLRDALETLLSAAMVGGGRLVVVDALDEDVAGFYQKYHFKPVIGNPLRLVMKISTIRKVLGAIE